MGMRGRLAAFLVPAWSCIAAAQPFQPPSSVFSGPDAFPYGSALQGLRVVVSPGHGWEGADGGFQRSRWKWSLCGSCEGIVEDLYNLEVCSDHLVPLLRQAGAEVLVAREIDRQEAEVLVDDGDPGYREVGPWRDGTTTGLGWNGGYRTLLASQGGSAAFSLLVPREGDYWVQVRWAAGTNRCGAVTYRFFFGEMSRDFVVDQRRNGSTWVHLARLHLPQGEATMTVEAPERGNCYVIADAVRLGGGMAPASGLPWWQMSARDWITWDGHPGLSEYGDVTVRPAYAEAMDGQVYLAMHANAGGTTTTSGTSTYRFNCLTDVQWAPLDPKQCDDPAGSAALQAAVQGRIVGDLRQGWDPAWQDDGKLVANFGELRVLEDIPGVLVESAFFDGTETPPGGRYPDNRSLHDPRFRYILARAYVRGLVETFAPGAVLPPADGPDHMMVRQVAPGRLQASWRPVEGARGYRVYLAWGGRVFDSGTVTDRTFLDIEADAEGRPVVVRVTALNAGGESRASGAVAARATADQSTARVLLVDAYDRQDAWVREDQNHRDSLVEHALAIADLGSEWGFDGAQDEALLDGDVDLGAYRVTIWNVGRESVEHETFSDQAQGLVASFLRQGGCVLASGSEIGWDLDLQGGTTDRAFLHQWFGASLADDDAGSRKVVGVAGEVFDGIGEVSLGTAGDPTYDPAYPDAFEPMGMARAVIRYGNGQTAAVALEGLPGRSMLMGFPLETVRDREARGVLMGRFLDWCRQGWSGGPDGDAGEVPDSGTSEEVPGGPGDVEDAAGWPDGLHPPRRDLPWTADGGTDRGRDSQGGGEGSTADLPGGEMESPDPCSCGGCVAGPGGSPVAWSLLVFLGMGAVLGRRLGQGGPSSRQRSSPPSSRSRQTPASRSGPQDRSR
ncbi:MAG TPA: hypothetical protein PLQ97_13515 [Myxococcota bacterium]|nr:hypothetical protein [Myxococcota bacterium]HQK52245.1 hypothetical protein [Myxococcota bacterium]